MNGVTIFLIWLALAYGATIPASLCPLETQCEKVDELSAICGMDEEVGCIRKFASKCHLDIATCNERKNFTDFSEVYCSMEFYFCNKSPTYERWTIFFGHEDE